MGAGQPGELDVQAVLHPGPAQDLVVGPGGLQLLGRVQVGDVHQAPGRQVPEARHPFVDGMVGGEVLALQVVAALPPIVEPDEERPDVVRRAFTDHEAITGQAAGLVDQGRGGRPAGLVERGGVHRGQDSIEHVVFAHDRACPPSIWKGTQTTACCLLHIEGHWRTGGKPEGDDRSRVAAACSASHGTASDWEPAAVETRAEPIRLCRKRSFATHAQRPRPARAAVCRIPCLILCLADVEHNASTRRPLFQ